MAAGNKTHHDRKGLPATIALKVGHLAFQEYDDTESRKILPYFTWIWICYFQVINFTLALPEETMNCTTM